MLRARATVVVALLAIQAASHTACKPPSRIGVVLTSDEARVALNGYLKALTDKGLDAGYELDGIHRHADPRQAVREAEAIFVGGGNTFRLQN